MLKASQILRSWSSSLHLPKSSFPPRPIPGLVPQYLQRCTDELYAWQARERPCQDQFVLHDGPPYANGNLHVGHALNKILKDIICRSQLSRGKRVGYVPGWDCHGLPIELKALRDRDSEKGLEASEIRHAARQLAAGTVKEQEKGFRNWAIMGDWNHAYTTMDPQFELRQLRVFEKMVEQGLIYREYKPVYWSPSSGTALAEAELEYDENHSSTAAFVKFKIVKPPSVLQHVAEYHDMYALIWTTTPWTLPANKAIAVHSDIAYVALQVLGERDIIIVASSRLDQVLEYGQLQRQNVKIIIDNITGTELAQDVSYVNALQGRGAAPQPIVHADFVSVTSGTGLVHMAPGHGFEDHEVCKRLKLDTFAPVDGAGCFTCDALPDKPDTLQGKEVLTSGTTEILELLRNGVSPHNLLWATHTHTHKYPIDWRTKKPVIVRATAQWFADVDSIKVAALKALEKVEYLPESGRARLESFVNGRSQWCISRQRAWGVPIPAIFNTETEEAPVVMNAATISHIIDVMQKRGIDAWWTDAEDEPAWIPSDLNPGRYARGKDTMDVWFDSGTTWTVLSDREPPLTKADLYIEGTDQHRGWFQSSLLTHVASDESLPRAPFRVLITHGFVLDKDGRKMSKSIGNVIYPHEVTEGTLLSQVFPTVKSKKGTSEYGMGTDALRLWAASADYSKDVVIGAPILKSINGNLQKLRLTFKWLLGVLRDYSVDSSSTKQTMYDLSDRAALFDLETAAYDVYDSYGAFEPFKAVSTITTYVSKDLSSFYFETAKDSLYAGLKEERIRVQKVCYEIFQQLLVMLAPITPLLVTEVLDHASPDLQTLIVANAHDPFKRTWAPSPPNPNKEFVQQLRCFSSLHDCVRALQEKARSNKQVGSGLDCRVLIDVLEAPTMWTSEYGSLASFLANKSETGELARALVVSATDVRYPGNGGERHDDGSSWAYSQELPLLQSSGSGHEYTPGIVVTVVPPVKAKCARCWRYVAEEKITRAEDEASQVDALCSRCSIAVGETDNHN